MRKGSRALGNGLAEKEDNQEEVESWPYSIQCQGVLRSWNRHMIWLTMLLLLLTPNEILKKTEHRVLLSISEWVYRNEFYWVKTPSNALWRCHLGAPQFINFWETREQRKPIEPLRGRFHAHRSVRLKFILRNVAIGGCSGWPSKRNLELLR